LNKLFSKTIF